MRNAVPDTRRDLVKPRRTWVVVGLLCCLVALAASARADCKTWILWSTPMLNDGGYNPGQLEPKVEFATAEECHLRVDQLTLAELKVPLKQFYVMKCWPSQFDPRGPKGK